MLAKSFSFFVVLPDSLSWAILIALPLLVAFAMWRIFRRPKTPQK